MCSYARLAEGDVRDDPDGEPEARSAERERFRMYVAQLTEEEAEHLERVPARRVLWLPRADRSALACRLRVGPSLMVDADVAVGESVGFVATGLAALRSP